MKSYERTGLNVRAAISRGKVRRPDILDSRTRIKSTVWVVIPKAPEQGGTIYPWLTPPIGVPLLAEKYEGRHTLGYVVTVIDKTDGKSKKIAIRETEAREIEAPDGAEAPQRREKA